MAKSEWRKNKPLIVLAMLFIAPITTAIGGGNIASKDVPTGFLLLIIFIVVGLSVYFLCKKLVIKTGILKDNFAPQENYEQPVTIRVESWKIMLAGLFGAIYIFVAIFLLVTFSRGIFLVALILFLCIGVFALFGIIKHWVESISIDKENITISRIFSREEIPIRNIAVVTLGYTKELRGGTIVIVFQTKDNQVYKWVCYSFKSAEKIVLFVTHWVPDILIEETDYFKFNRGIHDALYEKRRLF